MSDTWRIQTILNDQSAVTRPSVGSVGATVIRAPKGNAVPLFFAPGQEKRILNMFGTPSSSWPDIWEAIQYNKEFPLWISAPSADSYHGGLIVRPAGTQAFSGGVSTVASFTFSAFPQYEDMGTGDGSTTNFTFTVGNYTDYSAGTLEIVVDGTMENIVVSGSAPEVLTGDNGTGTFTEATGVVDYTLNTAPSSGEVIEVYYQLDISDAYFVLFDKSPSIDELAAKITHDGTYFVIDAARKSGLTYTQLAGYPKNGSIVDGTKDGFGATVFIDDLLADTDFVGGIANTAATFSSFVDDTDYVDFDGGSRGTTTITELTTGWDYFQQKRTYPVDIFFDTTAVSGISALFAVLRSTYQKYSAYLMPLANSAASEAVANKVIESVSSRGVYYYWNWARVRDSYNNSSFWTTLMGSVATKHAQMYNVYNGLAPAWIDENGHGGQISAGVIEMAYDPSEVELQAMDVGAVNPIVFDPQYGVMIVSQKTSLTSLSDYSYIGHSRTADYIIKNTLEQVLPYQIVKLNDADHRNRASIKASSILSPLGIAPVNLLREWVVICDETNNTDEVLNRREFLIEIRVKFTPFSESIKLIFTNVDQTTSVTGG